MREQFRGGGLPEGGRGGADAGGRRREREIAGVPDGIRGGGSHQLELRRDGRTGLGGNPHVVPAAIESDGREVGERDAVDLLRPRELSSFPQGGRGTDDRVDR